MQCQRNYAHLRFHLAVTTPLCEDVAFRNHVLASWGFCAFLSLRLCFHDVSPLCIIPIPPLSPSAHLLHNISTPMYHRNVTASGQRVITTLQGCGAIILQRWSHAASLCCGVTVTSSSLSHSPVPKLEHCYTKDISLSVCSVWWR